MCGIGGIRRFGATPITAIEVELLLSGLEVRGNDASGLAVQQENGETLVYKDDLPAWRFVNSAGFEKFVHDTIGPQTAIVLVHTRAATTGTPRVAANNHPMFAGNVALVHNGMIGNHEWLFKDMHLDRKAETDSDVLRAILDKNGLSRKGVQALGRATGSAAFAAISAKEPGKLMLGRSGNPLILGSLPDKLVFASEKHVIHRAMRPLVERFGILMRLQSLEIGFSPFPSDTAWLLDANGLSWHSKLSVQARYQNGYAGGQKEKDAPAEPGVGVVDASPSATAPPVSTRALHEVGAVYRCPKCKRIWTINENVKHIPLNLLHCDKDNNGCGSSLATATRILSSKGVN